MGFDDRFALRDSVEDLGDTMRDVIPYDILDEQRGEGDTDDRGDEVPPGVTADDQLFLNEALNKMNEGLEDSRCGSGERTYEEREEEHEVLLAHMAFPPFDQSIVEGATHVKLLNC